MTSTDWPTVPLSSLVEPDRGISYGVVQPGSHLEDGVPIVRVADVKSGVISTADPMRVSPDIEALHSRTRLRGGELLMTLVGTVGEMAIAPPALAGWNVARAVGVIPVRHDVGPRWVQYMIQSPAVRARVSARLNTTVQATLNLKDVGELPIQMPPQRLRAAITAILGSIDDKIEVNRRSCRSLEALAKAVFKDWFVDFGPIRARAANRKPYLAIDVWNVLPNRIDGGVPLAWARGPVSDWVAFNPTEALRKGVMAPYLDMAALPIQGATPDMPIPREYGSGMRFRNGDTLMARITPCLENGKTALVQSLPDDSVAWGSTEFIVMRPIPPVPEPFVYLLARDSAFREHAIRSMTGTSGRQRAQVQAIASFPICLPTDQPVWKAFAAVVDPLFAGIQANADESRTLTQLRDALLPKLMSGDIRIKDAEQFIEEATA